MNNDNQQPWQQPQNPDVSNLTKAIALQEDGGKVNYDAIGDNGTSKGAYQWQPGNFESEARQYGLDPEDFSPENQDKVAYSKVYSLSNEFKKMGYPAGEIPAMVAASWNAGKGRALDGSWKTNVGTTDINGKQISYDTPGYVQKVAKYYNQFSQSKPPQQPQAGSQSQQSQDNGLTNIPTWGKVALGIGGGLGLLGLNFIPGVGEVADAGVGAEVLGAGADAAGGIESATEGGLLSKVLGLGKTAATGYGVEQGTNALKGIFGKNQPQQVQPQENQPQQQNPVSQQIPHSSQQNQSIITPFTDQNFTQSNNASQQLYNAQYEALQQTPTGKLFSTMPEFQNGGKFNSLYGIMPDGSSGVYDVAAALAKSEGKIGELADAKSKVVGWGNERINLSDAMESDKAAMRYEGHAPESEWEGADKHIEDEYRKFAANHADKNGMVSASDFETFQKEQGRLGRFDIKNPISSAKRHAHRSINRNGQQTILKTIQDPERRHLYAEMTKHQRGLYDGQKVLKKLKGKKAHPKHSLGGALARRLAHYAEIAIGDKIGGPVGAVLGAFIGHQIERAADKKFGRSVFEQPIIKKSLELADMKSPQLRKFAEMFLEAKTRESLARPRLNAPSFIPMGPHIPQSGYVKRKGPGGLFEHLQNVEASRLAAMGPKNKKRYKKGQFIAKGPTLNKSTAREEI